MLVTPQLDDKKPSTTSNGSIHFLRPSDRKGSQRLTFIKPPAESEKREQVSQNLIRIKDGMRSVASLQLIISRPITTPDLVVDSNSSLPAELEAKGKRITEKIDELSRKLDLELSYFQTDKISLNVQEYFSQYEELNRLGEGCIGLVKRVQHRLTGEYFAVKRVQTTDEEVIRNMVIEFSNLVKLSHENIVKMYELYVDYNDGFQSESSAYVIMDFIDGQEMFEVINELGHYSEMHAKALFKQLLSAIEYMHRHGVCHRDLKPHNILCMKDSNTIKITDFNVSKFSENYKEFGDLKDLQKIEMWTYTGTVAFSAPEIFTGEGYTQNTIIDKCSQMVDLWSAGCILFSMLTGQLPFNAEYLNDLIENIKNDDIRFDLPEFETISEEAKDLISGLMRKVPQERFYPDQALAHKWFDVQLGQRRKTLKHNTLKDNIQHLSARKADISRQRNIIQQLQGRQNYQLSLSVDPSLASSNSHQNDECETQHIYYQLQQVASMEDLLSPDKGFLKAPKSLFSKLGVQAQQEEIDVFNFTDN